MDTSDLDESGDEFVLENKIIGQEYEEAIRQCKEKGRNDFADYLEYAKSTLKAVEFTGIVEIGDYVVFNTLNGQRYKFQDLTLAQTKSKELIDAFKESRADLFVVNHVQQLNDGVEITTPVNLNTTEYTNNFAVFNTFIGQYEPLCDLNTAITRIEELKQQYFSANKQLLNIYQEVKNADGWTALRVVE